MTFKSDADATRAQQEMNDQDLDGRRIRVDGQGEGKGGKGGKGGDRGGGDHYGGGGGDRGGSSYGNGGDRGGSSYGSGGGGDRGGSYGGGSSSREPEKVEDTNNKIYITGLPPNVTAEELQEKFGMIGVVARKKQKRGYPDQWPYKINIYLGSDGK